MTLHVAVLVGSLRKGAFSRSIALAVKELAPSRLGLEIVEIGDLPLYNPDLDDGATPAPWTRFRELLDADGKLVNDSTKQFLTGFMDKFADWVERHRPQ